VHSTGCKRKEGTAVPTLHTVFDAIQAVEMIVCAVAAVPIVGSTSYCSTSVLYSAIRFVVTALVD